MTGATAKWIGKNLSFFVRRDRALPKQSDYERAVCTTGQTGDGRSAMLAMLIRVGE